MPSNSTDKCYLCGATENLTRDHIPPKGLFPKPRPANLYTVPCCYACNNGASKEDEYFRVAASSLINAHATGKASFERVVESTIPSRRIAKQIAELRDNVEPVTLRTPDGDIEARRHGFDASTICRVLVRITKGLLAASHPGLDTSNLDFEITHIDQFRSNTLAESGLTEHFTRWGAGNGVYEHFRAASAEDYGRGMMVHVFYGAAIWMIRYQLGEGLMRSTQHPDWSEPAPGSPTDITNRNPPKSS
jgi:hypothetical protein